LKERKKARRAFAISFAIVFAALSVGTLSLVYLSGQIQVNHLPSSVPKYDSAWAKYVPSNFLQVAFQNFTMTRSVDPTVPAEGTILNLVKPQANISTSEVTAVLSVTLKVPNQTIDAAFLSQSAYDTLSSALLNSGSSNITVGSASIYNIEEQYNSTSKVGGWLATWGPDHSVELALGGSQAQLGMTYILETLEGNLPSFLSLPSVNQAAYIVNDAPDALAVGFQNFPGVVRTSNLTGIFIGYQGGSVQVSNVVGFNSTVTASSQYDYTKSVYKTYTKFTIYDSFIDVQAARSPTLLDEWVRLVGGA
jgi:hypothetical protein